MQQQLQMPCSNISEGKCLQQTRPSGDVQGNWDGWPGAEQQRAADRLCSTEEEWPMNDIDNSRVRPAACATCLVLLPLQAAGKLSTLRSCERIMHVPYRHLFKSSSRGKNYSVFGTEQVVFGQ